MRYACPDIWWAVTGSNRRHSRCKRDALPAELTAHEFCIADFSGSRIPNDTSETRYPKNGTGCTKAAGSQSGSEEPLSQLTASLSPLPALNFGCLEAGIWIDSPVRGLRPVEAFRLATLKVPKPTSRTSPPLLSDPVIESNTASTAFAASALERSELSATAATRSFLFTTRPFNS